MNMLRKFVASAALIALSGLAAQSASQPAGSNRQLILKPIMAGESVASSHQSLLNLQLGEKKVVGYLTSDNNGQHKLTLFVVDAFDGSNVPSSPIRYEAAIDEDRAVRIDTADGSGLEFAWNGRDRELTINVNETPARVSTM